MDALKKLKYELSQEITDYRAIPFWSWNNELDEQKLVEQVDQMYEAGMGGFIMHARLGLTTEYLGEKWFSCIGACLKRAKELGMNAWVYDENGWPSGFVGGKLLENQAYLAHFLEYVVKDSFDDEAFAVYEKTQDGYQLITSKRDGLTEYHTIFRKLSPANTDILNPEVVDAFISETHEKYYERFKDSFGKELAGFFTDEPQYYRWATPYSPFIAKEYSARFNADVKEGLIWLFIHDERGYEFRTRYYTIANDLYVDNFYKKLYDWCEAHNCKLTGHSIEENNLPGHMLGGAGCMATYEFEHIPGVDFLGKAMHTDSGAKQVGSVASQLGKKGVLTETYGCAGNDTNPRTLKHIAEGQYFNGVNLMCHHLYPYSMAGQAKHDHPPIFSKHSNWWAGFREFNDYFTNLGYVIANTKEKYDALIIYPLRDVYLEWVRAEAGQSVMPQMIEYENFLQNLRKRGIMYQVADERILSRHARIEDGSLVVGQNKYDCVIMPKMRTVASTTLNLLKQFKGKLLIESLPTLVDGKVANCDLTSNTNYDDITKTAQIKFESADGLVRITARKGEIGDYLFIKNYAKDERKIQLNGLERYYQSVNLLTFELEGVSAEPVLEPYGSLVLIRTDEQVDYKKVVDELDLTKNFKVKGITENYLVSDFCSISEDGVNFSETAYIHKHAEDLLRRDYKGKLFIKHTFTLREKMPLKLIMERGRFFSLKVNGHDISLGESAFDFNYCEGDISNFVKVGENQFVYGIDYYQHDGVHFALFDPMATESLRNCLYYDTHIENVYLKGDFVVGDDLSLSVRRELPKITSQNDQNGYPFFKGSMILEGEIEFDGVGDRVIHLIGNYQMAEIFVGDKKINSVLSEQINITSLLKVGKNNVKILLYSSLRNLFGPHHLKRELEEISGISPHSFTMRGHWGKGVPAEYVEKHVTRPFGLDCIKVLVKN